jgi:dolichol-phosphate mannosyltransferase
MQDNGVAVIIPTYNERKNIERLVPLIFSYTPHIRVFVVDDSSPDGTSDAVEQLRSKYPKLQLIRRLRKEGYGRACVHAFREVLGDSSVHTIVTMDADFSHDPQSLPELLSPGNSESVVVGSRYVAGGKIVGWQFWRRMLSMVGNWYCRTIIGMPVRDCTGGYNAISVDALRRLNLNELDLSGYAFIMGLKHALFISGASFREVPITFVNRKEGESKISNHIIREGIIAPWKMRFKMPQDPKNISRRAITALFFGVLLLALIPVIQTNFKSDYQGIPPAYVDDDIYYYGRMKEVADGNPFIGNPYFIEYKEQNAVAFFVPDWIASIPLLLHIPFTFSIVSNFVLWSMAFVLLVYLLSRSVGANYWHSAGVALFAYLEVYWLIFRPVAMQQVFPFFLLFLWAFIRWLRKPRDTRASILLALTSALPFYIYTYLWQIVVVTLGLVALHLLIQRKWEDVRRIFLILLAVGIFALPIVLYTVNQLNTQFYWETMDRIALVETHLPHMDAYRYGRWAILLPILYLCLRKSHDSLESFSILTRAVLYSGGGLFIMTISNVFIGKDVATAQHIGRMTTLWFAIFLPLFLLELWRQRRGLRALSWLRIACISTLLLLSFGFLASNLKRSLPFQKIAGVDSMSIQAYAEPLAWLERFEEVPSVIWANEAMSAYVPILTRHYVFWSYLGGLHFMSTSEVENRFLASRIKPLDADELVLSYEKFEGAGVGWRYWDQFNKNRLSCLVGSDCMSDQSFREWIGFEKLNSLLERQRELRGNMSDVITKYRIKYVIADRSMDEQSYFRSLPKAQEVWKNDRFTIYQFR